MMTAVVRVRWMAGPWSLRPAWVAECRRCGWRTWMRRSKWQLVVWLADEHARACARSRSDLGELDYSVLR